MDEAMVAAIAKVLEDFWEERSINIAESESVGDFIDEIDSQTAVDALIPIEKIVGMDIDATSVIRRGGYDSKEQLIEHLTGKVAKYVMENKK